jgi:hypothetical protein
MLMNLGQRDEPWRAAFLTNVGNNPEITFSKSKEFLKRILTHNAIGFSDDFTNRDYTVGYYIANARYRIERMTKYNSSLGDIDSVKAVINIGNDDNTVKRSQEVIWDMCYDALCACFGDFKKKLPANSA